MVELCEGGSGESASTAAAVAAAEPQAGAGSNTSPTGFPQGSASTAGGASTVPRSGPITISSYISAAPTSEQAVAEAEEAGASASKTDDLRVGAHPHSEGRLDWKRCLEVLKEAHLAGVEVQPGLMVLLLSRVPAGNTRKVGGVQTARCVGRRF